MLDTDTYRSGSNSIGKLIRASANLEKTAMPIGTWAHLPCIKSYLPIAIPLDRGTRLTDPYHSPQLWRSDVAAKIRKRELGL